MKSCGEKNTWVGPSLYGVLSSYLTLYVQVTTGGWKRFSLPQKSRLFNQLVLPEKAWAHRSLVNGDDHLLDGVFGAWAQDTSGASGARQDLSEHEVQTLSKAYSTMGIPVFWRHYPHLSNRQHADSGEYARAKPYYCQLLGTPLSTNLFLTWVRNVR